MRPLVKICGLHRVEDIAYANELQPDFVGFVFYKPSKRYTTPALARELSKMTLSKIKKVGVFVDDDIDLVMELISDGTIDYAQLHGNEDDEYINKIKSLGKPVIKAFIIRSEEDAYKAMKCPADLILLDNGFGTGKCFDWQKVGRIDRPYILAGGIDEENVLSAIDFFHPYAIDVSSAVETDGVKDYEKMKRFIDLVKRG